MNLISLCLYHNLYFIRAFFKTSVAYLIGLNWSSGTALMSRLVSHIQRYFKFSSMVRELNQKCISLKTIFVIQS